MIQYFYKKNFFIFGLVLIGFLGIGCGKSNTLVIIPEPVVDQVSVVSPEICLDSYVWIIDANPCIAIKGVKDNTTLKKSYMLIYKLSTFDVEFPLGLSLYIDGEFYNLVKITTDYGQTLEMVSDLPDNLLPLLSKAKTVTISYTNRKNTENTELSNRQIKKLNEYLAEIKNLMSKEPKLKIKR
ncbi:MAG: hypothetical protein JJT78_00915 [Leptospira sp.]|nr:hypothetical protein [Leptospira sp.]